MKNIFILCLSFVLFVDICFSATRTWEGDDLTNPTYYNDADNWGGTVPQAGDDVVINNDKDININANTANLKSWDMTGYVGTMSGTSNITIVGATASSVNVIFPSTGTLTWTGTLSLSPSAATTSIAFTTGTNSISNLTIAGTAGTVSFQDNVSFDENKTRVLTISNNALNVNNKSISGNSVSNRVLIASNTIGTARTISNFGMSSSNIDIRDITVTPSVDVSSIDGGSGNAGGNTGFTFTTAQDNYWTGGTGNWSDSANWTLADHSSAGRVPLPQDNAYFDNYADSGNFTVTADMPRLGKTIDTSGYTDASTFTLAFNSTNMTIFGGLDLTGVDTFTHTQKSLTFEGRGNYTLTSGGKSFDTYFDISGLTFQMVGGKMTLGDDLSCRGIAHSHGELDADTNDPNITLSVYYAGNYGTTRALKMGGGTWTVGNGNYSSCWNLAQTAGLTFDAGASSLVLRAITAGTQNQTINGGSLTYNNFTMDTDSRAAWGTIISGSNTFNAVTISAPKIIKFTDGTNTTVNSLSVVNSGTSTVALQGTAAAGWTITDANGGTNENDYVVVKNSTASPADTFYYGANGSATNSTGWDDVPDGSGTPATEKRRMILIY